MQTAVSIRQLLEFGSSEEKLQASGGPQTVTLKNAPVAKILDTEFVVR